MVDDVSTPQDVNTSPTKPNRKQPFGITAEPGSKLYLTDQITVQFRPEVSDARIEQLMADHGLLLEKEVRGVPRAFVFRVGPQARENPIKIANRLAELNRALRTVGERAEAPSQ